MKSLCIILEKSQAVVVVISTVFINPDIYIFATIEWNVNDLLTVDDSNSVKFKTTFVGEYTTYLTLTERVNTFGMILPNEQ